MEKKKIKVTLCNEVKYDKPFTWGDIQKIIKDNNITLEDDDIINSCYEEEFYSENNSMDSHYSLMIVRKRLETDEEYNKRIENEVSMKEWAKERRYQTYLKLKKEFEQ